MQCIQLRIEDIKEQFSWECKSVEEFYSLPINDRMLLAIKQYHKNGNHTDFMLAMQTIYEELTFGVIPR